MGRTYTPSNHHLSLAYYEPNLIVPGKKPVTIGQLKPEFRKNLITGIVQTSGNKLVSLDGDNVSGGLELYSGAFQRGNSFVAAQNNACARTINTVPLTADADYSLLLDFVLTYDSNYDSWNYLFYSQSYTSASFYQEGGGATGTYSGEWSFAAAVRFNKILEIGGKYTVLVTQNLAGTNIYWSDGSEFASDAHFINANTNDYIAFNGRDDSSDRWGNTTMGMALLLDKYFSPADARSLVRDPYQVIDVHTPSIILGEAPTSTIIEASLTFGSSLATTPTSIATFEAAAAYQAALSSTYTSSAVFETATAFAASLSTTSSATSVLETAVSFANQLAASQESGLVLEVAATFIQNLSQIQDSDVSLESNISFGINQSDQYSANANLQVALALNKALTTIYTTGSVFNESISLSTVHQVVQTASAIFEAAATYANEQGISDGSTALLNAIQNFGINQSVSLNSIANLNTNISFGITEDFITNGELITAGTIEAFIIFGSNQSINSQAGPNTWAPNLDIGIVQDIQSISIANLFAASTFNSQLAFTVTGGNQIEAAIEYAISQQQVQTVDISIEGTIQLNIIQILDNSSQADLEGSVLLSHQAAIQSIAQAVLNANLPLSSIQNINIDGAIASLTIQLPCGRTLLVQVENRSLTIQPENRNTTISGCN